MDRSPDGYDMAHGLDQHGALCRLEELLLRLPVDRALPDLEVLLRAADAGPELLADDRALKLLYEAALARPFGRLEEVQELQVEVELLTVEVGVLTAGLAAAGPEPGQVDGSGAAPDAQQAAIRARLATINARLAALQQLL